MVTSGNTVVTEVIDILNETKSCNNLPDLPVNIKLAIGGLVDGKPVVCGGYNTVTSSYSNECYIFENRNWELFANLIQARAEAAGSVVNGDHLWITGGETPSIFYMNYYSLLGKDCFFVRFV